MELQHTLRDDSTLTLGLKRRAMARLKLGGERPSIPLKDDPTMLFLLPSPHRSGKLRRNNEWSKRTGHNEKREE
jgi:hypothetical protein